MQNQTPYIVVIRVVRAESLQKTNIEETNPKKKKNSQKWRIEILGAKHPYKSVFATSTSGEPRFDCEIKVKLPKNCVDPLGILLVDGNDVHAGQVLIPLNQLKPRPPGNQEPATAANLLCSELEATRKQSNPSGFLYYWQWVEAYRDESSAGGGGGGGMDGSISSQLDLAGGGTSTHRSMANIFRTPSKKSLNTGGRSSLGGSKIKLFGRSSADIHAQKKIMDRAALTGASPLFSPTDFEQIDGKKTGKFSWSKPQNNQLGAGSRSGSKQSLNVGRKTAPVNPSVDQLGGSGNGDELFIQLPKFQTNQTGNPFDNPVSNLASANIYNGSERNVDVSSNSLNSSISDAMMNEGRGRGGAGDLTSSLEGVRSGPNSRSSPGRGGGGVERVGVGNGNNGSMSPRLNDGALPPLPHKKNNSYSNTTPILIKDISIMDNETAAATSLAAAAASASFVNGGAQRHITAGKQNPNQQQLTKESSLTSLGSSQTTGFVSSNGASPGTAPHIVGASLTAATAAGLPGQHYKRPSDYGSEASGTSFTFGRQSSIRRSNPRKQNLLEENKYLRSQLEELSGEKIKLEKYFNEEESRLRCTVLSSESEVERISSELYSLRMRLLEDGLTKYLEKA